MWSGNGGNNAPTALGLHPMSCKPDQTPKFVQMGQKFSINHSGVSGNLCLGPAGSPSFPSSSNVLLPSSKRKLSVDRLPTNRFIKPPGSFNVDQRNPKSSQSHHPGPASSQSLETGSRSDTHIPKRTRTNACSSNSSLLIKAYLKNPINPVLCPSLLKNYLPSFPKVVSPNSPVHSSASSRSALSDHSGSFEQIFPPKLNGPYLRMSSEDDCFPGRADGLFYGPFDPILVDPKIANTIYYTYSALGDSLLPTNQSFEYEVFDPVILHPPLLSLSAQDPCLSYSLPLSSSPQFSSFQAKDFFSSDIRSSIGPLNLQKKSSSELLTDNLKNDERMRGLRKAGITYR